jgi:hypothetical protein
MGTWTAAIFTEEQQARLGVTEMGEPLPEPQPPEQQPAPARSNRLERAAVRPDVRASVRGAGTDPEASRLQLEHIRARQAAGRAAVLERARQQQRAAGGCGGGAGRYPAHWGEPPRVQTRDLRPLPGGYGQGSSTLAAWITEKLAADERRGSAHASSKTSWPECVGMTGEDAVRLILAERPDLEGPAGAAGDWRRVHTVAAGDMLTEDWRADRVRVTVDATGAVTAAPAIG